MTTPHICLLYNPNSGRGRAAATAIQLAEHLAAHGCTSFSVQTGINFPPLTAAALSPATCAVVIGGDGTVHRTLSPALESNIPIYHFPSGTENLFARHYGMSRDPLEAARHVAFGSVRSMDLIEAAAASTSTLAAIMVSIGPDASVIHRLAAARTGPITHLSYLVPIVAEAFRPSLLRLTVTVDGRSFISERRGMLVISNLPTYARSINPSPHANPHDGLLDVAFLPASFSIGSALWLLACRLRVQHRFGAPATTGRAVHIASDNPFLWQADGEPFGRTAVLDVSVRPDRLRIVTAHPAPAL